MTIGGTTAEQALASLSNMTAGAVPIGKDEHLARIARAQAYMRAHGIAAQLEGDHDTLSVFAGRSSLSKVLAPAADAAEARALLQDVARGQQPAGALDPDVSPLADSDGPGWRGLVGAVLLALVVWLLLRRAGVL